MKLMTSPRRLFTLPALLAPHAARERQEPCLDTRMPEGAELAEMQAQALRLRGASTPRPLSRDDIELALDVGTRRYFPPRGETQVLERH